MWALKIFVNVSCSIKTAQTGIFVCWETSSARKVTLKFWNHSTVLLINQLIWTCVCFNHNWRTRSYVRIDNPWNIQWEWNRWTPLRSNDVCNPNTLCISAIKSTSGRRNIKSWTEATYCRSVKCCSWRQGNFDFSSNWKDVFVLKINLVSCLCICRQGSLWKDCVQ